MSLLTWPSTIVPAWAEWEPRPRTSTFTSPVADTEVLWDRDSRWYATLEFPSLIPAQWQDLQGLLANLAPGRGNTVALPCHDWPGNRGTTSGSPTATGNANATSITVNSMAGPLFRGDRMTIATRLYIVRSQATPSSGSATVLIAPPLRAAAAGAAVGLTDHTGAMRLLDDGQNRIRVGHGMLKLGEPLAVSFVEPRP